MSEYAANQVKPVYMKSGSLFECKAIITKMGSGEVNKKKVRWIQLNETIFHPKGGGQPSDEGTINEVKVAYVHKEILDKSRLDQFEIWHCFDENQRLNFKVGDEVELKVDLLTRKFHSRLQTAGHLVAEAVKKNYPELEAIQGNHYPDDSYVRFKMLDPAKSYYAEEIKQKASAEIASWIENDLPLSHLVREDGIRVIKITGDWAACGGTHVGSLKEIGSVEISDVSIKQKDGKVTVKYKCK